jgi:hypothetical protein
MKNILIFNIIFGLIFYPFQVYSKNFDMDSMLMELQNKNDKSIDKLLLDAESIVTKKSNDNYGLDEQENFSNLLEILGNSNLNDDILAKINLGDTILTYTNTAPEIDGFVAPTSIKDYYKLFDILKEAINNLKTNKNLTQNEIDILRTKAFLLLLYLSKIEFSTFQTLSEYYKTGQINLEPNSISVIDFETFCLRSGAPAPTTYVEPMTLEKNKASWQSKMISAMQKKNYSKNKIQEMLWDIQNQKSFDRFSKEEQNLIQSELPSYNLSKSQKFVEGVLSKVGLDNQLSSSLARTVEFKDSKYNKKENYYKILETPSTSELPKNVAKFAQTETGLTTRVESTNSYKNAAVIFSNNNNYKKTINPTEYIAKTYRKTQPLGFLEPSKKSMEESVKRVTGLLEIMEYFGLLNDKDKESIKYLKNQHNVDLNKAVDFLISFLPNPIKLVDSALKCLSGIIDNINSCVDVILEIPIAKTVGNSIKVIKALRENSQRLMDFSDAIGTTDEIRKYILNPKG